MPPYAHGLLLSLMLIITCDAAPSRRTAALDCSASTPKSRTGRGLPSLLLDGRETDVADIVVSLCTSLIQESDIRLRYVTVDLVRNHRFLGSTEFSRRNNCYEIEMDTGKRY